MGRYTVIFDACVLHSAPLRDLLLQLALADLFRAKWTDDIHEEWIRSVLRRKPEINRAVLERTRTLMDAHTRDCLVTGYRPLIETVIGLPDADDRHVVAAAIHARADAIVTVNLKDFPAEVLARHNLEAIHPDDFIRAQMDLGDSGRASVIYAAYLCRQRLQNPPKTAEEYLATLERQALPKTVAELRRYAAVI